MPDARRLFLLKIFHDPLFSGTPDRRLSYVSGAVGAQKR